MVLGAVVWGKGDPGASPGRRLPLAERRGTTRKPGAGRGRDPMLGLGRDFFFGSGRVRPYPNPPPSRGGGSGLEKKPVSGTPRSFRNCWTG